ncbi:centrosomal protein of 55 kDa-like [Hoplias malabaricus]|uniref:centrosomal protein of 55 kDa-like n=1 Tax=Hoplias malabaricus TaxID=27720 RepID=UPI00346328E5
MASKFYRGKTDVKSSPQLENEVSKLRKENAYLKETLDELARQKGEPSDFENNKGLLERILTLETLREKNSQQILSRDQEIVSLRQQLRPDRDNVVASLQAQLNQRRLESEVREKLFQGLKRETEEVKNKLAAVSAKYQELQCRESRITDGRTASRDATVIQEHLKDALEKNQQWLAYDQQREAYVKAVLERIYQLEQQLNQANEALQQKNKEASAEGKQTIEKQQHLEELLRSTSTELEAERERVAQGRRQLSQIQQQNEERHREAAEMRQQLQKERRQSSGRIERLCAELDAVSARLEEERLRSAELLKQVNLLQKSLLNQHEEKNQMSVLERQIQMSAKDLEDEKRDNQHLQRQLHKILKELRKAKDKVARLESEKSQRETPSSCPKLEKASKESEQIFTSPTRAHSLMDESFLECPNCRTQYPTSRHRELLVHIDQCFV